MVQNDRLKEIKMRHERIYINANDDRIYVDTYLADDKSPKPAMLVIPGGGYIGVSHFLEGEPIALEFFGRGYNAFVLNYGVKSECDVFPKQLLDAGRAMIYIREHAAELGVIADKVYAIGFSAGGHLCGSLATMFAYPEVTSEFGDKARMIRPDAVVLSYPVTVALEHAHKGSFTNLFATPYDKIDGESLRRVSLDLAVTEDSSPMFIWHTVEDKTVPPQGSMMLAAALRAKGVPFMLNMYPYGPHAVGIAREHAVFGAPERIRPLAAVWPERADQWIKSLV